MSGQVTSFLDDNITPKTDRLERPSPARRPRLQNRRTIRPRVARPPRGAPGARLRALASSLSSIPRMAFAHYISRFPLQAIKQVDRTTAPIVSKKNQLSVYAYKVRRCTARCHPVRKCLRQHVQLCEDKREFRGGQQGSSSAAGHIRRPCRSLQVIKVELASSARRWPQVDVPRLARSAGRIQTVDVDGPSRCRRGHLRAWRRATVRLRPAARSSR